MFFKNNGHELKLHWTQTEKNLENEVFKRLSIHLAVVNQRYSGSCQWYLEFWERIVTRSDTDEQIKSFEIIISLQLKPYP